MEAFNEVVNILCVDILFSFTDVTTQPTEEKTMKTRDNVGICFIGLLIFAVAVHISFLLGGQVKHMKQNCTKKAIKARVQKTKRNMGRKPCIRALCCKSKRSDSYTLGSQEP